MQNPDPNFEQDQELDFFEQLAIAAGNSGDSLVGKIVENAKKGDTSSLKLVEKAMNEARFAKEDKLKLTDEQYRRIILLAAQRLQGAESAKTA